jgi:hypothetical protein
LCGHGLVRVAPTVHAAALECADCGIMSQAAGGASARRHRPSRGVPARSRPACVRVSGPSGHCSFDQSGSVHSVHLGMAVTALLHSDRGGVCSYPGTHATRCNTTPHHTRTYSAHKAFSADMGRR